MLLAVDCGNTHLCLGLFDGEKLLSSWRISTDTRRTEDEWLVVVRGLLREEGYIMDNIHGMIIGSVVPQVNVTMYKMAVKYLKCPHMFVDHTTNTGVELKIDNPTEVGADRIINTVAAHAKYSGPLIVIDFGTATTFDSVNAYGAYCGGIISPGLEISQQALFSRAAKLANVSLQRPPQVIGTNTADSLRSGILWGYGGQVDSLVCRMKKEMGEATVIATGGLASFIRNFCECIDYVDAQLTLDGLRMIWDMNQQKR